jgi:hypothetical protein
MGRKRARVGLYGSGYSEISTEQAAAPAAMRERAMPNSALVIDACAPALRASFSAPQRGR